ncbi:MAG TPA: hypothetical protein VK327_11310 [Candidatus Paceibacterota bacterium]|nr:hypothetical protein [Candidatus Paceibacterota bacterium]
MPTTKPAKSGPTAAAEIARAVLANVREFPAVATARVSAGRVVAKVASLAVNAVDLAVLVVPARVAKAVAVRAPSTVTNAVHAVMIAANNVPKRRFRCRKST